MFKSNRFVNPTRRGRPMGGIMIGISRTRGGLGERVVDDASLISFGVADGKLLCVYTAANV